MTLRLENLKLKRRDFWTFQGHNPYTRVKRTPLHVLIFIFLLFIECQINPSPGRCLESQQKTFWTFSSKTSACTRITGCYNIRDRNTWLTREACQSGCIINETDINDARPLGILYFTKFWNVFFSFVTDK